MTAADQAEPGPATVLVVDDEPEVRALFARLLRRDGYRVVAAANGLEALALADEVRPQLVVLDIMMPGLDGLETLKELRRRGHRGAVIMLTAQGTLQTAREAMLAGATDYITKPFDLHLLRSALRNGIEDGRDTRRADVCAD